MVGKTRKQGFTNAFLIEHGAAWELLTDVRSQQAYMDADSWDYLAPRFFPALRAADPITAARAHWPIKCHLDGFIVHESP